MTEVTIGLLIWEAVNGDRERRGGGEVKAQLALA